MRARSIHLSRTCPVCGGRGTAEAKLPMSAHRKAPEFDLDDMAGLVKSQSLSLLLALVELLPYKLFACVACATEFRMESQSTKELVQAMLTSMQPVLPKAKPAAAAPRLGARPALPGREVGKSAPTTQEWEAESLDVLLGEAAGDGKPARL
jgi:hypothetical protein